MKPKLKTAFQQELTLARSAKDLNTEFYHLERAHILGQRYFWPHLIIHAKMFSVGIRRMDIKEIFGQTVRMFAVFPASLFGWVPIGNTGGANVSAIKLMPIPDDLKALLDE